MGKDWREQGGPATRCERIEIRVSAQEKAQIAQAAKAAGLVPAEWIRRRIILDRPKS